MRLLILLLDIALLFVAESVLNGCRTTKVTNKGSSRTLWARSCGSDANTVEKQLLKFDGGGIFFWYQAGVCKYLQEAGFSSHSNLSVLGTSAGALSATLLICGCDFDEAADIAISQCIDQNLFEKPTGLMFRWGAIIEDWLQILLSQSFENEADEESQRKLERLIVTATSMGTLLPWREKEQTFLRGFHDKDDLINACMSSVHIPLFLDSKLYQKYYRSSRKGKRYDRFIDGSFWPYFGKAPTEIPKALLCSGKSEETGGYLSPDEIYVCGDWKADEDFARKVGDDTGFVSLVTPDGLYEMMSCGYEYIRKEHQRGAIPTTILPAIK